MRPLIEILEDERTLMYKLESVYRYMAKTPDDDLLDILVSKKQRIERDLSKTRVELKERIHELL